MQIKSTPAGFLFQTVCGYWPDTLLTNKAAISGTKRAVAFFTALCFLFLGNIASGQSATATWTLTSSTTPAITGSVTAAAASFGAGVTTQNTNNATYGINGFGWSTSSLTPVPSSSTTYFQFSVTPSGSNTLVINSINLVTNNNESAPPALAAVFASTSSSFTTSTPVEIGTSMATGSVTLTPKGYFAANSGQTLYFRVYYYYASSGIRFGATSLTLTGFTTTGANIFTSTTSWTAPAGVTSVTMEAIGAGGGGGSSNSNGANPRAGGGGGGGAYVRTSSITVVPSTGYTLTIGTGGSAGSGGAGGTGNNTTATFGGTTVTAAGGSGGSRGSNGAAGAGGTVAASTGTVEFAGGAGTAGSNNNYGGAGGGAGGSTAAGGSASTSSGGTGGTNNGGDGANGLIATSNPGLTGTQYGGGGGGGYTAAGGTEQNGGAGAGGLIILYLNPVTQASTITFTSVTNNAMTVNWTSGNGSRRAVFIKQGAGAITNPTNGVLYTANTSFGSGTQLGTSGYYCVYDGTGSTVNVTNLGPGTYFAQVFEYNSDNIPTAYTTVYNVATASNNPNSQVITAKQFYSKSTGNLNTLATWGDVSNGSGTAPLNFTDAGQVFNIRNNATPTIAAAWAVSGTGSEVVVGDGTNACNFTIPGGFAFTGPIDISNLGTLTNQNTTIPSFGTLNAGSTVSYAAASGTQTLAVASYGNLTLTGGGTRTFPAGIVSIAGTFSPGSFTTAGGTGTIDFASASAQTIPAFTYNNLTNTGNGARTLASSGTVGIAGTTFTPGTGLYTVTGSTVNFNNATGFTIPVPAAAATNNYNNISVSAAGTYPFAGSAAIAGNFVLSAAATVRISTGSASPVVSIGGDLNISAGVFALIASSAATGATVNVAGDLNISSTGKINLEPTSSTSGAGIINISGDFVSTGTSVPSGGGNGIVDFGTGTITGNAINIAGNFNKSGTGSFGTTATGSATGFVFNKAGTQTFSYAGANSQYTSYTVSSASTLQLLTSLTMGSGTNPLSSFVVSGILNAGTNVVSGTTDPTFTLNSGGTIVTANTAGIAGTITVPGTKTFTAGAKYEFNSAVASQNMGFTGLTVGNPNSITVSNTFGTVTPDVNITFGNTATLNVNTGAILVAAAGRTFTFGTGGIVNVNGTIRTANVNASDALYGTTSTIVSTNTPALNLNSGSAIEFNGAAAQFTGARTFYNAIVSNTGGVTMLGAVTVSNALNLSTANLTIGTNTLTLGGAFSRTSGSLVGSNTSNLTIGGSAGNLFFATGTTNNFLKNFTLNTGATATLANALNITAGASANNEGTLTVTGTATLTTGGFLTIKSSAIGTARIAEGRVGGGYISGDVTVERYIPQNANKAWRLLASTTNGQTIKESWQENQTGWNVNTNPGFGTMIPANGASVAAVNALGFDTLAYGGSIFKYNSATDNLDPVTNTTTQSLGAEHGYFIFIRGDRGLYQFNTGVGATPTPPTSSAILRSTGTLFLGDQTAVTTGTSKYGIVRNPYPSRIDLRQVIRTGTLIDAYQVWDPKLGGAYGVGAYQTLTKNPGTGNYENSTSGGSYGTAGTVHNYIESGSAFFIQATTSGSAQVLEACKTGATGSAIVNRPSAAANRLYYSLTSNNAGGNDIVDGGYVDFDANYSNVVDILDVRKSPNFSENFGLINSGTDLVVERRAPLAVTDTIFFGMNGIQLHDYSIHIEPSAIAAPGLNAFLEDKFLNNSVALSLFNATNYNFSATNIAGSRAANRFRIVFRPQSPLPVSVTSIRAYVQAANIMVEWKVENQLNIIYYEIEKSADGRNFSKIGTQLVNTGSNGTFTYNWLDMDVTGGVNHFRIKCVDRDGSYRYTAIVKASVRNIQPLISVYPNPVERGILNLVYTGMEKGTYEIRLLNNIGQVVYKKLSIYPGGSVTQTFVLPSQITGGVYHMEVNGPNNSKKLQKVVINSTN